MNLTDNGKEMELVGKIETDSRLVFHPGLHKI
jgi:hypothetical protein